MDPKHLGLTLSLSCEPRMNIWRQRMMRGRVEKHHTWVPLEVLKPVFCNKIAAVFVELPSLFVNLESDPHRALFPFNLV